MGKVGMAGGVQDRPVGTKVGPHGGAGMETRGHCCGVKYRGLWDLGGQGDPSAEEGVELRKSLGCRPPGAAHGPRATGD